jgi:hypothetical protein
MKTNFSQAAEGVGVAISNSNETIIALAHNSGGSYGFEDRRPKP